VLGSFSLYSQGNFQLLLGGETDFFLSPYKRDLIIGHSGFGYKGNLTAIYGKVNIGYTHKTINNELFKDFNNVQLELDYWQSFNEKKSTSMWLNYAYGVDNIFPNHRIIFELWQKLFGGFLVSSGVNHYQFTESHATFINVGLENYFGRYWVEAKTYFYLKKPDITTTYALTGRMFFKDVNFIELGYSFGSAQDEPFVLESDLDAMRAHSIKTRITTNLFNAKIRISAGFTYMYEEYRSDIWRNRYALGVGLIYNIGK
jgi:YaiO family outer membrane protein